MKEVTKNMSRSLPRARSERRRGPVVAKAQGLQLARLLRQAEGGWWVRRGSEEIIVAVDVAVDPLLLVEGTERGERALLEPQEGGGLLLVGLLSTQRAVAIGRDGAVHAQVRRFRVTADEEVLLKSSGAFLQIKLNEAELYANRILCRARELTRLLGRMIKLN